MAELKNRQWLLAARPDGLIKESDFRWNEAIVPPLQDGQVLIRNLAFSFDPTQPDGCRWTPISRRSRWGM
jgi:hypothetical protein